MSSSRSSDLWEFPQVNGVEEAPGVTLLLLPHAGGSAHAYTELAALFPSSVRVVAGQYPGRGPRMRDSLPERLEDLVEPLTAAVRRCLPGPLVVFGHSLGAMVGWRLVRALEGAGRQVSGFVPASCLPPHLARPVVDTSRSIGTDELLAYLRRLGGLPEEVFDEPDLLELVLPILRADLALTADYARPGTEETIACPLLVLGGVADKAVPPTGLEQWADRTEHARTDLRLLTGGHFFYKEHLADVAAALTQMTEAALPVRRTA
ncbi:thioesterase II family protein [Streptomyces sp. NPDC006530]|uniref:thioesterase II family protein n=1 Tax=Streptomyces sp. NPDC006530 TaxID=3364750 RepID=UPI0036C8EED5